MCFFLFTLESKYVLSNQLQHFITSLTHASKSNMVKSIELLSNGSSLRVKSQGLMPIHNKFGIRLYSSIIHYMFAQSNMFA